MAPGAQGLGVAQHRRQQRLHRYRIVHRQRPELHAASASGEIQGPLFRRTFDSRAERNYGSGVSSAEQQFLGGNTDSQAGFGNDVQGLYNSINSVTQPSDTGEPTLQKF